MNDEIHLLQRYLELKLRSFSLNVYTIKWKIHCVVVISYIYIYIYIYWMTNVLSTLLNRL